MLNARSTQQPQGLATVLAIGTATPANIMTQDEAPDLIFKATNTQHLTNLKMKFTKICESSFSSLSIKKTIYIYSFPIIPLKCDINLILQALHLSCIGPELLTIANLLYFLFENSEGHITIYCIILASIYMIAINNKDWSSTRLKKEI